MATGYTYPVIEGKINTFKDFAENCAKAFMVEMREAEPGAKIPDEVKVDSYYLDRVKDSKKKLEEVRKISLEQAVIESKKDYDEAYQSYLDYNTKCILENTRLQVMLDQVRAWTPPSPDYQNFKKFMIDQLKTSFHDLKWNKPPERRSGETWLQHKLSYLIREVEYYTDQHVKAVEHAADSTKWVRLLKESLK